MTEINQENEARWLYELRHGNHEQARAQLGVLYSTPAGHHSSRGYCCLGVGCLVAEIEVTERGDYLHFGRFGANLTAPVEFHRWLGVVPEDRSLNGIEADIYIDWPDSPGSGEIHYDRREDDNDADNQGFMMWTASALNDECHLTFSQIADVIEYFGLRPTPNTLPGR